MAIALITGATGGIGLEFSRVCALNQIDLVLVGRREDRLKEIQHRFQLEYDIKVYTYRKDLTVLEEAESLFREIRESGLCIDYLINNAGFGDYGPFIETNWSKELQMIQLNIISLTYLTKHFLMDMVNRGHGRIMNVASNAAFQPGPLMAVYFATKAYVLHLSEAVGFENRNTNVTITTYCPGPTQTDFITRAALEESNLVKDKNLPFAAEVAKYGYKAMMNGKPVAVYGWLNKIQAQAVRISPRRIALWIVHWMSSKR